MADYVLAWCERCQLATWQTRTKYEDVMCSGGHLISELEPSQ